MHKNLKWQTKVELPSYPFKISYHHKIMALGSCFATHMAERLELLKYQSMHNPFGIQYNPASIGKGLSRLLDNDNFDSEELVSHQGLWHSWMHHGSYSHPDKSLCLKTIRDSFELAHQHLMQTDFLLITLGTSWVYRLTTNKEIVNNCHKFPSTHFQRQAMSLDEIISALAQPIEHLKTKCPDLRVLVTVSPIRHLKDGAIENQRSKAALVLALAELEKALDYLHYFPAYEIMMDELRDYRFYGEDLTQPSLLARDYIWQTLENSCLDGEEAALRRRVLKLQQGLAHRPLHPKRKAHQLFLQKLLQQLEGLAAELPNNIDWRAERAKIENLLQAID